MGKWKLFSTDYKLPKSNVQKHKQTNGKLAMQSQSQEPHHIPQSPVTIAQEKIGKIFRSEKKNEPQPVNIRNYASPPARLSSSTYEPQTHENSLASINRSQSDYETDGKLRIVEESDLHTGQSNTTYQLNSWAEPAQVGYDSNSPWVTAATSRPSTVDESYEIQVEDALSGSASDNSSTDSLKHYPRSPIARYLDEADSTSPNNTGGFQRGGNYRSLPMQKGPTYQRKPPGVVFLICRGETKKSLLPSLIKHMDGVRALFVKTFPSKLRMPDMKQPWRKIYNFDRTTQLFYELEDLSDVKDGAILKLYEEDPGADTDDSYFSEPELEPVVQQQFSRTPDLRYRPSSVPPPERSYTPSQQRRQLAKTPPPVRADFGFNRELSGLRSGSVTPQPDLFGQSRMQRMETQLASLTAWVHSEISSRPGSAMGIESSSELVSPSVTSYDGLQRRRSGSSRDNTGLHQPLRDLKQKVRTLKTECSNLRRIQQANAQSIEDSIKEAVVKISDMMKLCPGVHNITIRAERSQVDQQLDGYLKLSDSVGKDLVDLEISVEELRADVINKRCRVSAQHVDGMAVHLSKISRSLANLKTQFPQLKDKLSGVVVEEVRIAQDEQKLLKSEPVKLDSVLKRCKKLTGTLYTLKRLAMVQEHRPPVAISMNPGELSDVQQQHVISDIGNTTPDHEQRLSKITEANMARERNMRLSQPSDISFENALDMANKALQESTQMAVVKPKVRETSPEYDNPASYRQAIAVEHHENGLTNGSAKKTPPTVPVRTSSVGSPTKEEDEQKASRLQSHYEELKRMQQLHESKQKLSLDVIREVDE